jgi:hypothetical protein
MLIMSMFHSIPPRSAVKNGTLISVNPKADKPPWHAWNKVKHADYKPITQTHQKTPNYGTLDYQVFTKGKK